MSLLSVLSQELFTTIDALSSFSIPAVFLLRSLYIYIINMNKTKLAIKSVPKNEKNNGNFERYTLWQAFESWKDYRKKK